MDFSKLSHISRERLHAAVAGRAIAEFDPPLPFGSRGKSPFHSSDDGTSAKFLDGLKEKQRNFRGQIAKTNPRYYLEDLGLPHWELPTLEQLKEVHRKLARQYHPDRTGGGEAATREFGHIQTAYERIKEILEEVEQKTTLLANKIRQHMTKNSKEDGWGVIHNLEDASAMPSDHLPQDVKVTIIDTLRKEGYQVEERFERSFGGNAIFAKDKNAEYTLGSIVAEKLRLRLDPAAIQEAAEAVDVAKKSELVKEAKKLAGEKDHIRNKWILGGIIVTTVAIGAVLAYNKKKKTEQEQDRRQDGVAARSISYSNTV